MPKYSQVKQDTRNQVDVYDIRKNQYHPNYEVTARTTDHFTGVGEDGNAKSLVETLKTFQQGVGTFSTLQELYKKDNKLQAKADYKNNIKRDTEGFLNLGAGYEEEWNTLHGETKMTTARLAAQEELKANNFFVYDQDKDAKVKATIDKHYTAAGLDPNNKYQMVGASAQYQSLKDFATQGVAGADFQKQKTQHMNDIGVMATNLVTELSQNGIKDPTVLRKMLGNLRLNMNTNFIKPQDQSKVAVTYILDATNTRVQTLIDQGKLDEAEDMYHTMINTLKTPDKDGVDWSKQMDDNGNLLGNHLSNAEATFANKIHTAEVRLEQANQKIYKENYALYSSEMFKTKSRDELKGYYEILQKAYDENEIDAEHMAHGTDLLNRMLQGDLNVIEDPKELIALQANVLLGKASVRQIYQAVAEGKIRRDTAEKSLGMVERIKAHAESLAMQQDGFAKQMYFMQYNQGMGIIHNTFGGANGDPETLSHAEDMYNDFILNQKKSPSEAKALTLKSITEGKPIGTVYASAQQAKDAYLKAKTDLSRGKITQEQFDDVVTQVKPWRFYTK